MHIHLRVRSAHRHWDHTWHFLDNHKKVQTFFLGGLRPPRPPFKSAAVAASASQVRTLEPSRPLSRPPGGGSTWSMVWNVDHRTARSSPTRPADSGTFFWAPFRNFVLHVFRQIPGEARNAKSGFELTYNHTFPGSSTKHVQKKSSGMGPKKKFRNLQAWLEVPGQVLAQT